MTGRPVCLLLGAGQSVADWSARHRAGAVPDRYPYGLDKLEHHGFSVSSESASLHGYSSIPRRAVRLAGGRYDWASPALGRPGTLTLAWDEGVGLPAALRSRRPVPLLTGLIWATDSKPRPPVLRLIRRAAVNLGGVFVLSQAQVVPASRLLGLPADRIHYVPFGVDPDFFSGGNTEVDRDLVVSVGNDRHRDFDTLLAGFDKLRRTRPASTLSIVSSTFQNPHLPANVQVIPHLSHVDLRKLIARAAVVVTTTHPNLHGSGMTSVLEAIAMRRPGIVTLTPGMGDYIEGDHGLVGVNPRDPDDVARAMLDILCDPGASDARGLRGRAIVESKFNTSRMAQQLGVVLDSLN